VVINGYLQAGGLQDPDDKLGLAYFTAAALMRGTTRRSFQALYDALESAGASLGFQGGTHTTGFSGKALSEDLDLLLGLLADAVRTPIFPADQIARLRAQLLTGLALRAQDTGDMASLTFDQVVYEDHPYSRPEDGFTETVQAITREDLVDFHAMHFGPQGLVLTVVGAITPDQAVDKVRETFGDWTNPGQAPPPPLPAVKPLDGLITRTVNIPGKSQANVVLGAAGPARRSEDFLPASLGNSVLGQFGMYGRIGEVVREQSGLAYYAYSSLGGGVGPGPWQVSAGIAPENVERVIALIRAEIERYIREPVSKDELADTRANYIGRLPLALESNSGVAGALLNLARYELGLDYYQRYAERISAITPEEILAVSGRYLDPDQLAVAVAGSMAD
jgi:zinc protease